MKTIPLLHRLSARLALAFVIVAIGLGIAFSLLQIYLDYFSVQREVDNTTEQVLQTLKKPATQAVYQLDPVLADEVVRGLLNYGPIFRVVLTDDQNSVLAEEQRPRSPSHWRWLSAGLFGEHRYYSISLSGDEPSAVAAYGMLQVHVDTHLIAKGFIERSVVALLFISGLNLLLVTFVFFLVQSMINQPLSNMAGYLAGIDPANPGENKLHLPTKHQNNELGLLAASANNLLQAISEKSAERERLLLEMQEARAAAEAANIAKSQFIAKMSHELRTPLNAVIGYSEILQEEVADMTPEEISGDLAKILQSGQQLLSMVNDVLDISKIESGQVEFHQSRFAVSEMLEEILGTVRQWAPEHGNTFEFDCPGTAGDMLGDRNKIAQSLLNLLENACKYTENGLIRFSVRRENAVEGPCDWMQFEISDTGIGIPKERQESIFAMFDQADNSSTRAYDGMGLGLAISSGYARMMGGALLVESEVGKGSVFRLRLPTECRDVA